VARPGLVFRGAGDVIRRHRAERDWTLAELAAKADLDKGQIAKFEANQVGLNDDKLKALADAFGMAADALSLECLKAVRPELFTTRIGQLFESMSGTKKLRVASKKRLATTATK
jgi:transcriptional regulator with XRE-family HTH domain